jgi:hypothetical protein
MLTLIAIAEKYAVQICVFSSAEAIGSRFATDITPKSKMYRETVLLCQTSDFWNCLEFAHSTIAKSDQRLVKSSSNLDQTEDVEIAEPEANLNSGYVETAEDGNLPEENEPTITVVGEELEAPDTPSQETHIEATVKPKTRGTLRISRFQVIFHCRLC